MNAHTKRVAECLLITLPVEIFYRSRYKNSCSDCSPIPKYNCTDQRK